MLCLLITSFSFSCLHGNRYTPNVSEVLKVAWVQYMAFFIVVAFLLYRLNAFIFRHRVRALYTIRYIV